MLDRVVDRDKVKFQVLISVETIKRIKKMSADKYQTQSKWVTDMVNAAWGRRDVKHG